MDRKIIVTGDKSKSLLIDAWNETYHSIHGAMQESQHVFIDHGLQLKMHQPEIRILEMGFGTGLNALLTMEATWGQDISIRYHTLEKFPVEMHLIQELEHQTLASNPKISDSYIYMHTAPWDSEINIDTHFLFKKTRIDLADAILPKAHYDLVYFDAFGPKIQPELWSLEIMHKLFAALKPGGLLTTYCAQGQFRRNLRAAGFKVFRREGPPGKREMTHAIKENEV